MVLSTIWSNPVDNGIEIALSKLFDMLPSFLKQFFIAFSALGDFGIFLIIGGLLLLLTKRTRIMGVFCLLALVSALIFNDCIFKNIFDRTRPFQDPALASQLVSVVKNGGIPVGIVPSSSSFPSGHTYEFFSLFGGVTFYYIFKKEERKNTLPFLIFFGIVAFLMGFTRILLSHHYFTDVLCGAALGFGFSIINYLLYKYVPILIIFLKNKFSKKTKEKSE